MWKELAKKAAKQALLQVGAGMAMQFGMRLMSDMYDKLMPSGAEKKEKECDGDCQGCKRH